MATWSAHKGSSSAPTLVLTVNEVSQNVANRYTTVSYSLVLQRPSYVASTADKSARVSLGGLDTRYWVYNAGSVKIGGSDDKLIASGQTNIYHNADGTKTMPVYAFLQIGITWSGTYIGNLEINGTMTLTPIPISTTPTLSSSSVNMGQSVTINTPRTLNRLTHTLRYQFGNASGTIATNVATSSAWSIPMNLASQIPNATSGTCAIYCDTYDGSSLIGTKSVNCTLNVPTSIVPTISNVSISEATEGLAPKFGAFVQSKSKLNVAITASGAYGSTITKYETYIQSVPYYEQSFTSEIITTSGTVGVVTIVYDSRGRTTQVSNSISVVAYSPPIINSFKAWRIDSLGNESDEGERIAVEMNFAISPVGNLNDHTYELQCDESTFSSGIASWTYSGTQKFTTTPVISIDESYFVKLIITDYFQSVEYEVEIPTTFNLIDFRYTGKGIAFGKASEKDLMEIAMDVELTGALVQEEETEPTLLNNWADYGSGYKGASYWKDDFGVVHISGLVKGGTTADGTIIFTLPSGYRPTASEKFFAVSLNAICVIDIYANGNVTIRAGANSGWLSLSGISFRTA